jgi:hypothetical protein
MYVEVCVYIIMSTIHDDYCSLIVQFGLEQEQEEEQVECLPMCLSNINQRCEGHSCLQGRLFL